MQLFWELFKENGDKTENGRKVTSTWKKIIEANLHTMLTKTTADKNFLAHTAQEGVMSCAMQSPIPETTQILVEGTKNKMLKLSEFALKALVFHVEFVPECFLSEQKYEQNTFDIIHALFAIRDKGQPRLVKHCDPALKLLREQFTRDGLKEMAIKAFTGKGESDGVETKVENVLLALEPKKKVNHSSNFRQLKRVGLRKMFEENKQEDSVSVEVMVKEVSSLKSGETKTSDKSLD